MHETPTAEAQNIGVWPHMNYNLDSSTDPRDLLPFRASELPRLNVALPMTELTSLADVALTISAVAP